MLDVSAGDVWMERAPTVLSDFDLSHLEETRDTYYPNLWRENTRRTRQVLLHNFKYIGQITWRSSDKSLILSASRYPKDLICEHIELILCLIIGCLFLTTLDEAWRSE